MGWAFFVPGKDTKGGRLAAFLSFTIGVTLAWNIYYWWLLFAGWGEHDRIMSWRCEATLPGPITDEAMETCVDDNTMAEFYNGLVFFLLDCYFAFELYRWYKDAA